MSEDDREGTEGTVDEGVIASGNVTLGIQSFEYTSLQIQVEDAAH
jgi:hypothetical protein